MSLATDQCKVVYSDASKVDINKLNVCKQINKIVFIRFLKFNDCTSAAVGFFVPGLIFITRSSGFHVLGSISTSRSSGFQPPATCQYHE